MSLIATKDKNRKQRIQASGKLPRVDYYCPNRRCSAIMILVDCDDDIKTDHFRCKVGYEHIDGCQFKNNNYLLKGNNFTDCEYKKINEALEELKKYLELMYDLLAKVDSKDEHVIIRDNIVRIVYNWLGLNLEKRRDTRTFYFLFRIIRNYINTFSMNKFKYGVRKDNVAGFCFPFRFFKIELCQPLFDYAKDDLLKIQDTILHEACHQCLWMKDYKFGDDGLILPNKKKKKNADNWSKCYVEIITYIQLSKAVLR